MSDINALISAPIRGGRARTHACACEPLHHLPLRAHYTMLRNSHLLPRGALSNFTLSRTMNRYTQIKRVPASTCGGKKFKKPTFNEINIQCRQAYHGRAEGREALPHTPLFREARERDGHARTRARHQLRAHRG